jgi:ABC-type multidrug transport system fused ATPase/permease subunit
MTSIIGILSASEQCDRREAQQVIEAAQAKEIQARLVQERQIAKFQRLLLGSLSVALAIVIGVGLLAFQQYRQAKLSEIKALASFSKGFFASSQQLDAMLDAIRAQRRRQELGTWDLPKIRALKALEYACDWGRDDLRTNVEVKDSGRLLSGLRVAGQDHFASIQFWPA